MIIPRDENIMTSILSFIQQQHDANRCQVCGDLLCGLLLQRGYDDCAGDDEWESVEYSIANLIRKSTGRFKVQDGLDILDGYISKTLHGNLLDILATAAYMCRWGEMKELSALEVVLELMEAYPFVYPSKFIEMFRQANNDGIYEDLADVDLKLYRTKTVIDIWFDEFGDVSVLPWLPREMLEDIIAML